MSKRNFGNTIPLVAERNGRRASDAATAGRLVMTNAPLSLKATDEFCPSDETIDAALASSKIREYIRKRLIVKIRLYHLLFRPYFLKLPIAATAIGMALFFLVLRYPTAMEKLRNAAMHRIRPATTPVKPLPPYASDQPVFPQNVALESGRDQRDSIITPPAMKSEQKPATKQEAEKKTPAVQKKAAVPSQPLVEPYSIHPVEASITHTTPPLAAIATDDASSDRDSSAAPIDALNPESDIAPLLNDPGNAAADSAGEMPYSDMQALGTSAGLQPDHPPEEALPYQHSTLPADIDAIDSLVRSFGGRFEQVLDHNGDYFKLKFILPDKEIESFKAALSQEAIISFAFSAVPLQQDTSVVVFEMHARE